MATPEVFWSPDFFQKLTLAIPTAGIALVFGYLTYRIAREQKNIQKEKVISDLFDRRFTIYCAYRSVLEVVSLDSHLNHLNSAIADAAKDIRSARFVLDSRGYAEVKKIDYFVERFQRLKFVQAGLIPPLLLKTPEYQFDEGEEKSMLIEAKNLLSEGLPEIFEPYLTVSDFRNQHFKGKSTTIKNEFDGIARWHQVFVFTFSATCLFIPLTSVLFFRGANLLFIIQAHAVISAIFSSLLWLQAARRSSNIFPNSLAAAFTGIATLLGTAAANDMSSILSFVLFCSAIFIVVLCSLSITFPNIRARLIPS